MIIPPWAYAAAAGLTFAAGFGTAWQVQQWRWHAHEAKALKQADIALRAQLARQNSESGKYETEREQSRVQSVDRAQAIRTVYRTVEVPGVCAAPDSVRSVLDNAVRDANRLAGQPDAAVQPAAKPSGGS